MAEPITKEQRDGLIARREALWAEYVTASTQGTLPLAAKRELKAELERVLAAYFDGLPRVPLSRCPFCDQPLHRAIDPWGTDGYWWQEEQAKQTAEPMPCPHFGVLQGAVHLNGLPPAGGLRHEAFVGPAVPFVIPRVLAQPGVVAVISSLRLANGYTAYPIAYFAGQPLPAGAFTQSWTRSSYNWAKPAGGFAWRVDTDPWDFELEPWIREDRLLWIEPADPALRLHGRRDGACPYLGLEGTRERQYLIGGELRTTQPPEGETVDPFSP